MPVIHPDPSDRAEDDLPPTGSALPSDVVPRDAADVGNAATDAAPNDDSANESNVTSQLDALSDLRPAIERALEDACRFTEGCPDSLANAIRYALLAPGKRLRPALVLMAAEACGGTAEEAIHGGVAVEMIHAYSLIHDDLPAMDDDDLRRGRPTVHIEFDEATAILAGDALQPLAFEHLCKHTTDPVRLGQAVQILSSAAGPERLVGGQAADLAAESGTLPSGKILGESGAKSAVKADLSEQGKNLPRTPTQHDGGDAEMVATREEALLHLESIHRRKTGALFAASLDLGAVLVGASEKQRESLAAYASDIGLAFQVVDDLLDHTADEQQMGKRVGKDADRGKLTYPGLMGLDGARHRAQTLIQSAREHVAVFGPTAWRLDQLAIYMLNRTH